MKAMIFAAGLGKRLGTITKDIPKALVSINGRSILRIAVEKLTSHGFDEIIVNVHHHADLIEKEIAYLRIDGYRVAVSDERDLLLETGGGLFRARSFFDKEPFLLYSADIITDLDLGAMLDFHKLKKGIATLAVADHHHSRVFMFDKNDLLCGWKNKSTGEEIISRKNAGPLTEISFSAISIVDPEIFGFMNEGIYSMTPLYLKIAETKNIFAFRHDSDFWIDIGTPEELEKARSKFKPD